MNAEIISIGTEILLGEIVDTNSAHIARQLRDIGVNIFYMASVGDNLDRIQENIQRSLERSDLVITTGGLGPTVDDVTRQAVAAAVDRELVFHQELLDDIAMKFEQFGVKMTDNNRLQAYVPDDAIIVHNPVGTAPCYIVESDHGMIISLPGVPSEMKYLMENNILPYLREKMGNKVIKALVLKTAGIGESTLDEKIADLMKNHNPTVGLAAHIGQTDIRITARADDLETVDTLIADMEAKVRERVGDVIYGTGKTPLQNALVDILTRTNQKIITIEAGAEFSLIKRLKAVPGGTDIIAKSVLYASVDDLVEVNSFEGDDFKELIEAEARRLMEQHDGHIVIGVLSKGEATAISVIHGERIVTRLYNYGTEATRTPFWAATWGMSIGWRLLREAELANE